LSYDYWQGAHVNENNACVYRLRMRFDRMNHGVALCRILALFSIQQYKEGGQANLSELNEALLWLSVCTDVLKWGVM
jgi:hypothetical protein